MIATAVAEKNCCADNRNVLRRFSEVRQSRKRQSNLAKVPDIGPEPNEQLPTG
jgi:hypothetical protein